MKTEETVKDLNQSIQNCNVQRTKMYKVLEEIKNIILRDNSMIIDKEVYFELQCGEPVAFKLQKIFNLINEVLGC